MEREFTISTGTKIFYGLIAVVLFGFSVFLFGIKPERETSKFVLLIPGTLLAVSFLMGVNLYKRKVVISSQSIISSNVFNTRELAITNVKGYRVGNKIIYIEPISPADRKLKISNYIDLAEDEELIKWLHDNFTDLNKVEYDAQKKAILQDQSLGSTPEDREKKLAAARLTAVIYSMAGFFVTFLSLINYSRIGLNYLIIIVLLLFPLLGISIIKFSNGLIKLISKKSSPYPFIFIGTFMPVIALFVKSVADFEIVSYHNFWFPFAIVSIVVAYLLIAVCFDKAIEPSKVGQVVFIIIFAALYGYGSIMQVNEVFDRSNPQMYHATVLDMDITHGKSTSYNLTISKWGPIQTEKRLTVDRSVYDRSYPGSMIGVSLKNGFLNIPWYVIAD